MRGLIHKNYEPTSDLKADSSCFLNFSVLSSNRLLNESQSLWRLEILKHSRNEVSLFNWKTTQNFPTSIVLNPPQCFLILTSFIPFWLVNTPLLFFYVDNELFSGFNFNFKAIFNPAKISRALLTLCPKVDTWSGPGNWWTTDCTVSALWMMYPSICVVFEDQLFFRNARVVLLSTFKLIIWRKFNITIINGLLEVTSF